VQHTFPVAQLLSVEQSWMPFEGVVQYLSGNDRSTRSQAWPLDESQRESSMHMMGQAAAWLQALPAAP
jgi:hypothetical protein